LELIQIVLDNYLAIHINQVYVGLITQVNVVSMAVKNKLNEIAKAIEAEAYNKGWNDCLNAVMSSVRQTGRRHAQPSEDGIVKPAMRRPRKDSDAAKVLTQITEVPGLVGVELVAALAKAGSPVHERTVRTALHRLRGRFIEQKGDRWYPISS
jgi:hypothetical protein